MGRTNELLKWIDRNNEIQCRWAISYLRKRGINIPPELGVMDIFTPFDALHSVIDSLSDYPDRQELIIRMMKLAWNQKKLRDRRKGKKAYNFVMSTKVKKRLDDLVRESGRGKGTPNTTLSEVLEKLIMRETECRQALKYELMNEKAALQEEKAQLEQLLEKRYEKTFAELKKLRAIKKQLKIQTDFLEQQLATHAKHFVLTDEYGLLDEELNEEQKARVSAKIKIWKHELSEKMKTT